MTFSFNSSGLSGTRKSPGLCCLFVVIAVMMRYSLFLDERSGCNGLLGPPTKFTTLRSVEPLRLRSQRRYLLLKTASFLSVSSQLLHRVNSGNYIMLPRMVNIKTLLKIQLGFRVASSQIISDSY